MSDTERQREASEKGSKKYFNIGVMAFGVIAASMLLFFCLFYLKDLLGMFGKLTGILKPFIYGLVIAYLLNPIFNRLHTLISGLLEKPMKKYPARRESVSKVLSSLFSVVFLLAAIYALLALIIPELYDSVMTFAGNLSSNLAGIETWLRKILDEYPDVEETVLSYYDMLAEMATNWFTDTFLPGASSMFNAVTSGLGSMFGFFYNIFIGVIFAIYLLNGKKVLVPQCRKMLYALVKKDWADAILKEVSYADQMFSGFVYGKIIDSLIIGVIYFIVGTILNIPYVEMISVIVGVTNVIPFFGPYIGAIPSALILLLTNPMACLKFIIAIIVIQQFDGNFLGPKILGNTTGLSSFWVLFSILLFGGLFSFVGMLIGVPLFAVIYHIVKSRVEYVLVKKGLPVETDAYVKPQEEKPREIKFFEKWKMKGEKADEQDQ